MEHVPPKQFYPKLMRDELRDGLWKVPAHRKCNQSYKLDEEYFYHYLYPLVADQNGPMGTVLLGDIGRRAAKPQSQGLLRRLLRECTHTTRGGLLLPPSLLRLAVDQVRIQNVAIKVAQCLFHKDHGRFIPRGRCKHVELCQNSDDVQELFALVCGTEKQSVAPSVFAYWRAGVDGLHCYSMLFWEAFMFCVAFQEPLSGPHGFTAAEEQGQMPRRAPA